MINVEQWEDRLYARVASVEEDDEGEVTSILRLSNVILFTHE